MKPVRDSRGAGRVVPAAAVLAVGLLGAIGCGQKGPLYLPDHNGAVVTRPGARTPPPQPAASQPAEAPRTEASPSAATPPPGPDKKKDDSDSSSPR